MRRLAACSALLCLAAGMAAAQVGGQSNARQFPLPIYASPGAPVKGGDVAYGAYQRGLYLTASREALSRLERNPGDTAAMTLLGELYNQGLGVRQNPPEAARWYRLAADRGEPRAMATLALMLIDGRGMPKAPERGRAWLEKAAGLGEPTASFNLALLLLADGTEEDAAKAAILLRVASEGEVADAQHALGVLYANGRGGLPRDRAEAAMLFLRAARNGSLAGEVEWAIAQFNGDGTTRDEANAARQFRHAAGRGNAIAQNRLARLYVLGRGVQKNLVEAAAWNIQASAQGLTDAWLERQLEDISKDQRKRAEALAAARMSQT